MRVVSILRASAFLTLIGVILGSRAETFTAAGNTFQIQLPQGYCAIGESVPERALIANSAQGFEPANRLLMGFEPANRLLMGFANCDELAQVRTGKRQRLHQYGFVLAALRKGEVGRISYPRDTYLALLSGDEQGIERAFQKAKRALDVGDPARASAKNFGVVRGDLHAVYIAATSDGELEGGEFGTTLTVTAATALKQIPINVVLAERGARPQLGVKAQ